MFMVHVHEFHWFFYDFVVHSPRQISILLVSSLPGKSLENQAVKLRPGMGRDWFTSMRTASREVLAAGWRMGRCW